MEATSHINETPFAQEYRKAHEQIMAVEDAIQPNVESASAVATALAAVPKVRQLRSQIAKLEGIKLDLIDNLETYAKAYSYANTQHTAALREVSDLQILMAQALKLREGLRTSVQALIANDLIDRNAMDGYQGSTAYKGVAKDLQLLAFVLQSAGNAIEGKCASDLSKLGEVDALAAQILRLVGMRETPQEEGPSTSDIRARAFTLFLRSYDELRRAVIYLRWHQKDADTIAPSLHAGKKRKAQDEVEPTTDAPPPAPTTPTSPTTPDA